MDHPDLTVSNFMQNSIGLINSDYVIQTIIVSVYIVC